MADVFSPEKRSIIMSRIRGKGNKSTELRLIEIFRRNKIHGWRRGIKLPGKPDFVFREHRVIIFVDGCFWHGCPKIKHSSIPKTRSEWWATKLQNNKKRDRLVTKNLRSKGWNVIRIWECDLDRKDTKPLLSRIIRSLEKYRDQDHTG
jgi:DNA mismatch endonuclease (patch repair protein)